jgi:hypothetical protein
VAKIFLVGNGASLKQTNLDLLIDKPSMAVNKIHLFYKKTKWRPTHYVKVDYSVFDPKHPDDWREEILQHVTGGETCLLWDAFHSGADKNDGNYEWIPDGIGDWRNVTYIPRCEHHYYLTGEWHDYCTGLNSIVTMANWAYLLGFTEIVLVGCDGKFTDPKKDHMVASYYKKVDGEYVKRNNDLIQKAHDLLAAKCPIPIWDATVGGHLTQHRKVILEELV